MQIPRVWQEWVSVAILVLIVGRLAYSLIKRYRK